jgi:hypothetical protein
MLYQAEVFNGLGYVPRGENSPYVWAGTNHEQLGKYVADGQFDPSVDDPQLGVAAVLIRLAQKRPDIAAALYPATPEKPPVADPATPATTDQILAAINGLRADLAPLIAAVKGTVPPVVAPPTPAPIPAPVPAAPPPTSILQQPGVGLGVLGGVLTGLLQAFGVVGPMTGDAATTAGQVLPILSAGTAALGATGTFGTVLNALGTVMSLFTQAKK